MLEKWLWLDILIFLSSLSQTKELKGPPRVYPSSRLVTAQKGDQVKLPCPISANPVPLYEWEKDGRPVDDTWPRYGLRRHFLRIKGARESDSGEFTCIGVNGFGQQTFTYSLLIYGEDLPAKEHQKAAVLFEVSPTSPSRLEIGQSITLICRTKGNPTPKVTWRKDAVPMHRSGVKLEVRLNSPNDEGKYTCVATNPLAIVSHEFSILMQVETDESEPRIKRPLNTTIVEGENATLQCFVESHRTPEMQWLKLLSASEMNSSPKSNNTLRRDGRAYRYLSTNSTTTKFRFANGTSMSKLNIAKASIYDDGTYICVAATNEGFNYKEIHLTVLPIMSEDIVSLDNEVEAMDIPWIFISIPGSLTLMLIFGIILLCRARRISSEKTYPTSTKNITLAPEEHDTPIHSRKPQVKTTFAPDLIFQDGSSFSTNITNMCHGNAMDHQHHYQENPYLDPQYSDPFVARFEPSDHSYAFLTQSSTSPLPPPPYAFPATQQTYVYAPPSPASKFVVHCNL